MVLVGLSVAIKALNFTGTSAFLLSLLEGLLKIVGILVLKPFLEAMLDIPDIAMQQRKRKAPVALPPAELVCQGFRGFRCLEAQDLDFKFSRFFEEAFLLSMMTQPLSRTAVCVFDSCIISKVRSPKTGTSNR